MYQVRSATFDLLITKYLKRGIFMDISSLMSTLLSKETVEGVSQKTGASTKDVTSVLQSALPQLLGGADKQANNSSTASGFAAALTQHAGKDTSSISSFLSNVDLIDGQKIVGHLLGSNGSAQVASQTGVSASTTSNIMSSAAPLLMSLLGKQSEKEQKQSASSSGIGGLLSGLFGGSSSNSGKNENSSSGISNLLGGLFGGSKGDAKKSVASSVKPESAATAVGSSEKKPVASGKTAPKSTASATATKKTGTLSGPGKAALKAANTGTAANKGTIAKRSPASK